MDKRIRVVGAASDPIPAAPRVCIVTPVYNGAEFLDETLLSLTSQAGSFRLRLHVQDGGSNDGTVAKIREWQNRIQRTGFARVCEEIHFTWDSSDDNGMYDAINKAFAAIGIEDGDILAWLNSDDLLMPGAIQFACDRMSQMPEVHWVASRPCETDASGVMRKIHPPQSYNPELLQAGLHDSRHFSLVMQEGSFWRGWLWIRSGGLRADLRLAGDYDLWRRFAKLTPLYSCEQVLAGHRRHQGQLSAQADRYFDEIEGSFAVKEEREEMERVWSRYQRWLADPERDDTFAGFVIVYHAGSDTWSIERRQPAIQLLPPLFVRPDGSAQAMIACEMGEGFSSEEGPYPHLLLPLGLRFAQPGENKVRVSVECRGSYWVLITYRSFTPGMCLEVLCAGRQKVKMTIPATQHERNGMIVFQLMFRQGLNELLLRIQPPADTQTPGLMVLGIEALPSTAMFS